MSLIGTNWYCLSQAQLVERRAQAVAFTKWDTLSFEEKLDLKKRFSERLADAQKQLSDARWRMDAVEIADSNCTNEEYWENQG